MAGGRLAVRSGSGPGARTLGNGGGGQVRLQLRKLSAADGLIGQVHRLEELHLRAAASQHDTAQGPRRQVAAAPGMLLACRRGGTGSGSNGQAATCDLSHTCLAWSRSLNRILNSSHSCRPGMEWQQVSPSLAALSWKARGARRPP